MSMNTHPETTGDVVSVEASSASTPQSALQLLLRQPDEEWMLHLSAAAADAICAAATAAAGSLRDVMHGDRPYAYYGGFSYATGTMWTGEDETTWRERHTAHIANRKAGRLNLVYMENLSTELRSIAYRLEKIQTQAFLARRIDEYGMKLRRAVEHPKKWIYLPALKRATKANRPIDQMWRGWTLIGERRWGYRMSNFSIAASEIEEYQRLHERFPIALGDRYAQVWEEWNDFLWREHPQSTQKVYHHQPHSLHVLPNPRVATLQLMRALEQVTDAS